jgi:hypothetical protein
LSDTKLLSFKKIVKQIIKPPQVYSWQTFILLSVVSLFFAFLSYGVNFLNEVRQINGVQNLIANCGFLFLIIGISWIAIEKSLKFRAWLIAGLICLFIWGNIPQIPSYLALIIIPLLACIIAILPYFIDQKFYFHIVEEKYRLKVILIFGIHVMLSCWLQVYFLFNHWINQYPSLLADDLSKSSFILNLNPRVSPRGIYWLKQIQFILETQLKNKQWLTVERWLYNLNPQERMREIKKEIIIKNNSIPEDQFWQLELEITELTSGYGISISAIWQGVKSKEKEYSCKTICLLQPLIFAEDEPELTTSQFQCNPPIITGWKNN